MNIAAWGSIIIRIRRPDYSLKYCNFSRGVIRVKKTKWMSVMALMLMVVMALSVTACGSKSEEKPAEEPEKEEEQEADWSGPELSEDQMDDLYQQAAEQSLKAEYADYMPDKIFGHAETFNIARDGDKGTWDAFLVTGEYVVLDGKAYCVSGANGEAILKFDYTKDGPKLNEVVWSTDGGGHEEWLKENFTEEGLKYDKEFLKNEKAVDELTEIVDKKASDELGVPVEKDLILDIDKDAGTYEIVKTIESGSPEDGTYKFDTETVKKGKLEDLK